MVGLSLAAALGPQRNGNDLPRPNKKLDAPFVDAERAGEQGVRGGRAGSFNIPCGSEIRRKKAFIAGEQELAAGGVCVLVLWIRTRTYEKGNTF